MFRRSKPEVPKTLEHWYQDVVAVERLREIVADPVFRTAVATLLSAAQPTHRHLVAPESDARRLAWLAGYNDFADGLVTLTRRPLDQPKASDEWAHYQ